jgi:two-component system, OmpR family, sensor histidine kinase BaeS
MTRPGRPRWDDRRGGGRWAAGGPPPWDGAEPRWRRRRGFGCVFALLFLIVAGSLVAATGYVLSHFGGLAGFVALVVVVAVLVGVGRGLRSAAGTLDELVEATRAVENGDYSVRVGPKPGGLRPVRQLVAGFDTMTARLETDERQRRTLLAEISHELRTPLAVVQGNLEAIVDGVYPPDPAHLAVVLDETRVLGRLIDDLRTLALSEAGTLPLHREPTDPDVLIADVIRSMEATAAAVGVQLTATTQGDLPILDIDPVRIREVLVNLVANAVRHTPSGGSVTIAGRAEPGWVRLDVRDTGGGVAPDLLPHIFDRFVTGDDSRGTGLGLAIARQLVVAHGGEIAAESALGAGTTITVRLPLTGA